jgi:hypothetical protein
MKYKIEKNTHEAHRPQDGASSCFPEERLNRNQQETTVDLLVDVMTQLMIWILPVLLLTTDDLPTTLN